MRRHDRVRIESVTVNTVRTVPEYQPVQFHVPVVCVAWPGLSEADRTGLHTRIDTRRFPTRRPEHAQN